MSLQSAMNVALSGMQYASMATSVYANNLANSQTVGFKQSSPVAESQAAGGVRFSAARPDVSQGSIAVTSRPLDLALQGSGYFMVEGSQGRTMYTRDGQFSLSSRGEIVTSGGERVLGTPVDDNFQLLHGQTGAIRVTLGSQTEGAYGNVATLTDFQVGEDGIVSGHYTDGQIRTLGQIRMTRFPNAEGLEQTSGNLLGETPASGLPVSGNPGERGAASIIGGAVELSNTQIATNIMNLDGAARLIKTSSVVLETAVNMFDSLLSLDRRWD